MGVVAATCRDANACQNVVVYYDRRLVWGYTLAAVNMSDSVVIEPVQLDDGSFVDCTDGCAEYCDGQYKHYEMQTGRHLAINERHGRIWVHPWTSLDEANRMTQAGAQGWLDATSGRTNWGQSHYTDDMLRARYDHGYKLGLRWLTRQPWWNQYAPVG